MMRTFFSVFLLFVASTSTVSGASEVANSLHAESANFEVRSFQGGPAAADVLQDCRELRADLQRKWLGDAPETSWLPRCEIVVHASRKSYLHVVGRGGSQTLGSSLVELKKGNVVTRRIDLLPDASGRLTALPHELTHVVLADRFAGRQPPRWLDEGIATLADSARKQALHFRDCQDALRGGTALRLINVLELEQFASAQQVPAFYGQSLSLVRFLAAADRPETVLQFVESALETGYDHALRQHYGIDSVAALEREWRDFAANGHGQPASLIRTVGHQQ